MKLKTLKDLEKAMHVGDVKEHLFNENNEVGADWMTSVVLAGDLKLEAVKWVKALRWDRPTGWKFREFVFIEFFNLTEDDLK